MHPAAGCDSWKSAVSGNWNAANNWTSGVPDSTTAVCINLAGAYTVSVTDYETADSVSLGASSGTQPTLALSSSATNGSADLYVSEDVANAGATISTTSTGSGSPGYYTELQVGGTLTNGGTITTSAGASHSGSYLEGSVVNTGTVSIGGPTYSDTSPAEFDNFGAVTVATT